MKKKIIISILLIVLLSTTVTAIGIGVPSTLDFKQPLRNKEYVKKLDIQATNIEKPMLMNLTIENYNEWFDYDEEWISEVGTNLHHYKDIKLKVPSKAPFGFYTTKAKALICNGENINLCIGAIFNINFEVVKEKIIEASVPYIRTRDTYYGNLLCVEHPLECNGNSDCIFKVSINNGFSIIENRIKLNHYSKNSDAQTCINIDEVPTGLYYANTKVYVKNKGWKLIKENNPHFNIFEEKW